VRSIDASLLAAEKFLQGKPWGNSKGIVIVATSQLAELKETFWRTLKFFMAWGYASATPPLPLL